MLTFYWESNQWHLGGMSWLRACKERSDRYSFQHIEGMTTHHQGGVTHTTPGYFTNLHKCHCDHNDNGLQKGI